ncbi:MAG TPA: hypothetical protein VFY71_15685 [Planctomycetota bacterium]|nr:hypothetical protein [Planctomycetota bacterium]
MSAPDDGPVTQSRDTSPEIEALQVARWRAMEPWEKIALVSDLQRAGDNAAIVGILLRHPAATTAEVRLRLAALKYGRNFMTRYFDWDPDVHGW